MGRSPTNASTGENGILMGFGATINIINGGLECNTKDGKESNQALNRLEWDLAWVGATINTGAWSATPRTGRSPTKPSTGENRILPGFGATINIINGGLECNTKDESNQALNR